MARYDRNAVRYKGGKCNLNNIFCHRTKTTEELTVVGNKTRKPMTKPMAKVSSSDGNKVSKKVTNSKSIPNLSSSDESETQKPTSKSNANM